MHRLRLLKSQLSLYLRMLREFNRARTELAIHWLKKSRATIVVLNIFVLGTLAMVKFRAVFMRKWLAFRGVNLPTHGLELCDAELPLRVERKEPRVLIVAETSIPQCLCYRVQQKVEQFERLGWHCEMMPWYDSNQVKQRIHFHDVIIFYRVPGLPDPLSAIEYAQQLKKIVIYDVDDLIFDRARLNEKFASQPEQLSDKEFKNILDGADLYRAALETCSYGITTTPTLQIEIAKRVRSGKCFILPNAMSADVYEVMSLPKAQPIADRITILYGSGTRTHDDDFKLVADSLARVMQESDKVHLAILGYLTLPSELESFADRIQRLPMMEFSSYLRCLQQADISIAPLVPSIFADGKSEIKWLEAAAFKVPCVVSPTAAYKAAVASEEVVYAASADDWYQALNQLVTDKQYRQSVGDKAYAKALSIYAREPMAQTMRSIIADIQADAIERGELIAKQSKPINVMVVNVLYPPSATGGATIVVERTVNELLKSYGDQFEVNVVASDIVGTMVNNVREYGWKGINVTGIGVSMEGDFELNHRFAKTEELFSQLVEQHQPDLIHFHCIQRLTGSVVEVARQKDIPYLVTVHDGWWLSEHQFMLDMDKQLINPNQLNPLVAVEAATQPKEMLARTNYLAGLLKDAKLILAVSDYQAQIYRDNGFTNITVNKNGILPVAAEHKRKIDPQRSVEKGDKLRIGYLGGVCDHKGYYQIKAIFEASAFDNIELVLVDIFEARDFSKTEQWGSNSVTTVGAYAPEQVSDFYQSIEVLLAPSIWPESFGLVTREAAAHGVWVIAADAGGLAEDVVDGENGWVFPMSDGDALTAILREIDAKAEELLRTSPNQQGAMPAIRLVSEQTEELAGFYREYSRG